MVTAFELLIAVVVLFVVLGTILFTMQSEPHNKFDERYIEHDIQPASVASQIDPEQQERTESDCFSSGKTVNSTLRDQDAKALHNLHDPMADHLI